MSKHRWERTLCDSVDCCNSNGCCNCGLFFSACVCPSVIYADNLNEMKRKRIPSTIPDLDTYSIIPCLIHAVGFYGGTGGTYSYLGNGTPLASALPAAMQTVTRGDIRKAYDLEGTIYCDFCTSWFCYSCALVQEFNQLRDIDLPKQMLDHPAVIPNSMQGDV